MAEFTNVAIQTVAPGANVIFSETPFGCSKGYVTHREGSGIFRLKGVTNQCRALYKVTFGANIAVPTGETVGAISVALTIDGEALGGSTAIVTPAAVDNYFNVFVAAYIPVERGCCITISAENTSDIPVNVQNANLIIERVA